MGSKASSSIQFRRARFPVAVVELALRRPSFVISTWIILAIAMSPGLLHLKIDTSTDSVLDRNGEDWSFYQKSQEEFGGDEIIVIAMRSDEPYSPRTLRRIVTLSTEFEGLAGVERVDSLSTLPVVQVTTDGDVVLDPALTAVDRDPQLSIRRVRRLASVDRIIPNTLVSVDGRTVAITLVLESGIESRHAEILDSVRAILGDTTSLVSGVPVFRVETNRKTRSEILQFAPITALLLSCTLFCLFRSVRAAIFGLLPGVVGALISICAMGLANVPISITTMILPSMLIALGCAYSMHVLFAAEGAKGPVELSASLCPLALPLALSGLTTVVGLMSLSVIRIDAVRHMGIYGSIGVLVVTAFSLTSLPAILVYAPLSEFGKSRKKRFGSRASSAIMLLVEERRGSILLFWLGLSCVLALGLTQLQVETDPTTWLPRGHPVRDSYEGIRSDLSGISPMNLVVSATGTRSVLEPAALRSIDSLAQYVESLPEVGRAISIADPLRQLNGGFENDPLMPLPRTLPLAEQYMLLLDGVDIIGNVLSFDHSSANILLRVNDNGSGDILGVAARAEDWWRRNGVEGFALRPTGIMYEFARAEDAIAYGQLIGLSIALATIFVILWLIFRRASFALIALIPNALPLVVVFGAMGILGIPLDAGTALIGALALGIAVDDTVHFMTHFIEATERGVDTHLAMREAFQVILPAVISSTAMISIGFGVFVFSEFSLTRNLGWLTGSIMIVCLLADVTLLAALLVGQEWRPDPSTSV